MECTFDAIIVKRDKGEAQSAQAGQVKGSSKQCNKWKR
jgi:hypothetical protein